MCMTSIWVNRYYWKQFLQIVTREGENGSHKLREFMQAYVEEHKKGNPQLKIIHYVKPDEQQPTRALCSWLDGVLNNGQVHCQKKQLWIPGVQCYSCKNNRMRKRK